MAKAEPVPIDPAESFVDAGRRAVAVRARELLAHGDGVLDTGEIARVHDMRVASRRLRAVLEVFAVCFDAKAHKDVLTDVKRLADALGERRDPDVQLERLQAFATAVPADQRPGVEHLLALAAERQAAGNVVLAETLRELHERDLGGRLEALAAVPS